jgi:DNA-directed RNA polymerase subunit beta'
MSHELPFPSKISLILDIPYSSVDEVIYFVNYIVINNNGHDELFANKEVIDLTSPKFSKNNRAKIRKIIELILTKTTDKNSMDYKRASEYYERLKDSSLPFSIIEVFSFIKKHTGIEFGIGAEAIQKLLQNVDLAKEKAEISSEIKKLKPTDVKFKKQIKRLEVIT